MPVQQNQKPSLDPICQSTASSEMQQPEFAQEEWQGRLRSLEQCICELLIENQRLRMSLRPTESQTDFELQRSVDRKKPAPGARDIQQQQGELLMKVSVFDRPHSTLASGHRY